MPPRALGADDAPVDEHDAAAPPPRAARRAPRRQCPGRANCWLGTVLRSLSTVSRRVSMSMQVLLPSVDPRHADAEEAVAQPRRVGPVQPLLDLGIGVRVDVGLRAVAGLLQRVGLGGRHADVGQPRSQHADRAQGEQRRRRPVQVDLGREALTAATGAIARDQPPGEPWRDHPDQEDVREQREDRADHHVRDAEPRRRQLVEEHALHDGQDREGRPHPRAPQAPLEPARPEPLVRRHAPSVEWRSPPLADDDDRDVALAARGDDRDLHGCSFAPADCDTVASTLRPSADRICPVGPGTHVPCGTRSAFTRRSRTARSSTNRSRRRPRWPEEGEKMATTTARPAALPANERRACACPDPRRPAPALLRFMLLMRATEERALTLYRQGKVPGSYYDGRGQEATASGRLRARPARPHLHPAPRPGRALRARRCGRASTWPDNGPRRRRHRRPRRQHALRRQASSAASGWSRCCPT